MKGKGCQTCWYWSESPKANNSGKEFGECRHKSPSTEGFPRTRFDSWCGEFSSCGFMPPWPASSLRESVE